MKICVLGDGLTSFALAKILVKRNIAVDLLTENKSIKYSNSRTFGITKKKLWLLFKWNFKSK